MQDALGRLTCLEVPPPPPPSPPPPQLLFYLTNTQGSAVEREKRIWEHNRLLNDVHDLNVAVREANLNLFAERERALELAAENDMLKAQEIEDRRRIQQLMDIAQPLAHDVTYFTDTNPAAHGTSSGGGKFRLSVPRGENGQQQQERALRALFTAQPSNDTTQLRVESLELQVGCAPSHAPPPLTRHPGARAAQNSAGEKCGVGIRTRLPQVSGIATAPPLLLCPFVVSCVIVIREELESATHRLNAHVTELTQRLCKTEVSLQANIHDYLSLRAETLQNTRQMQEQLVAANATRDDALMKLADMQVLPLLHHAHHPPKSSSWFPFATLSWFPISFLNCSARGKPTSGPLCKT